MVYVRTGVLAITLAITGNTAAASPISLPNASVPKPGQHLTAEQLAILDALFDHGWHFGWFKDNGADPIVDGPSPDLGLGNIGLPGSGDLGGGTLIPPGVGQITQPVVTGDDLSAQQVTPVPEPATLLLLGGGIAGIAAKVRHRRKRQTQ